MLNNHHSGAYVTFTHIDPSEGWLEEDLEDLVHAKEYLSKQGLSYNPDPLLEKYWIGEPSHLMMFNIRLNKELSKYYGNVIKESTKYCLESIANKVWDYFVHIGYLTPRSRLTPSVNFVDCHASVNWNEVTI